MTTQQGGTRMPGPVTFESMVRYIGEVMRETLQSINRVGDQLDRHEEWHRSHLEEQLRDRRRGGWNWTQTIINVIMVACAVTSLVVVLLHTHG